MPSTSTPARPERSGSSTDQTGRGRSSTPDVRPAPRTDNNQNQQWRKFDRTTESAPRGVSSTTEAPASRDRQESAPAQDRGNDWRRFPSMQERNDAAPSRNTAAETPRDSGNWRSAGSERQNDSGSWRQSAPERPADSGNWRQSAPRDSGRQASRPQLDMRQPIVTPRSSGPSGGGYRSGGGGSSGGGRSAPAPSRSGGGGGHSSGGSTPHRGR